MEQNKYIRSENYMTDRIDDELIMMSIEQGMYYNLDPIGTEIWEQLTSPTGVDELCTYLLDRYDVEPAVCRADVSAFIDELASEGMIRLA